MKYLAWMVGIAGLVACSKSVAPPAGERAPESTRSASEPGEDRARASGAASKGAAFASYVALFTPLDLPSEFPLAPAAITELEARPMQPEHRDAYLCGTRFFDCAGELGDSDFYYGYRFDISEQAIGLIYYVVNGTDARLVLMTHDRAGAPVGSIILAGDFDDMTYGYDGELRADKTIVRNRYVWGDGGEKEYVKDRRFRITASGGIEETIL